MFVRWAENKGAFMRRVDTLRDKRTELRQNGGDQSLKFYAGNIQRKCAPTFHTPSPLSYVPTSDTVPRAVPRWPGPPTMTWPRACPAHSKLCLVLSFLSSHSCLQMYLSHVCFPHSSAGLWVSWLIKSLNLFALLCEEGLSQELSGSNVLFRSNGSVVEEVGRVHGTLEIMPQQWLPNLPTVMDWMLVSPKNPRGKPTPQWDGGWRRGFWEVIRVEIKQVQLIRQFYFVLYVCSNLSMHFYLRYRCAGPSHTSTLLGNGTLYQLVFSSLYQTQVLLPKGTDGIGYFRDYNIS